jgi:nucleoside-diphosphate-sugar epimerase
LSRETAIERAAIIGATGATGIHLARQLVEEGTPVRVLSRSADNLERHFSELDVERSVADAADAEAVRRGIGDCDVVFDCVGLPAAQMHLHPVTAAAITEAARYSGSRCLQVSSFWSYLPAADLPINEGSRRQGGNHYIQMRRQAEDIFVDAGGAVLQLPDFFGPAVAMSSLQRLLEEAVQGDTVNWIGSPDTERDYVYVPDAMRVAVKLARFPEAGGRRWVLAGSGALSARRAAEVAGHHLGKQLKVRGAPPWLLKIMGLFSTELRAFLPMVPHYAQPVSYDDGHLTELIGPIEHTTYDAAIAATLDWISLPR